MVTNKQKSMAVRDVIQDAIVEISRERPELTTTQLEGLIKKMKLLGLEGRLWWLDVNLDDLVRKLIAEGRIIGRHETGAILRSARVFFDVEANGRLVAQSDSLVTQNIKRTVLDLGTKFTRLQVAEIAESCQVGDEAVIIAIIKDMIAKHQVDAQYFTSTKAVAFNQQANLASRDAFIAELEAEFARWGEKKSQGKV